MRTRWCGLLLAGFFLAGGVLRAQQVCPGLPYVANTPEDELMQAVNGAEKPEEQVSALDKFAQAHADSRFMPCVDEYYTIAYLKLSNYDKAIEFGEKGLAANYQDVMLMLNTIKAYVAAGKVSDAAIDIIMKAPDQIKSEANPAKPPNVKDDDWKKNLDELAESGNEQRAYFAYSFFQMLPRITDPNKQIEALDKFSKTYPDAESKSPGQINSAYFNAYLMTNKLDKALEYGEKTVAADPNNVATFNRLAYLYAIVNRTNLDKAGDYAKKAMSLAQGMKKPDGVADDAFKKEIDNQVGMAHLTLGYIAFLKGAKTKRLGPATQEFKTAIDTLGGDPSLQGEAAYFLGYAYEAEYPANHKGAIDALTRSASLPSRFQNEARELLGKVRKAAGQ